MKYLHQNSFAIVALFALTAASHAQTTLYEPFGYTPPGSMLQGKDSGVGFSGAWFPGGFNAAISTNYVLADGPLIVPGLASAGHRVQTASQTQISGLARDFASSLGDPGTTHYLSFVLRPEGTLNQGAFNGFFGIYLRGSTGADLSAGKPGGGNLNRYVLEQRGGSGQVASAVTTVVGSNALLVIKAQFFAGNDRFTLYVDPLPGLPEPASGVVKSDINVGTVSGINLYSTGAFAIDELRIGTTYASVTVSPAPEIAVEQPSGTGLTDGSATVDFGTGCSQRTFTIKSIGNADLTGLGVTITGPNSGDFTVTANPTAPVGPGASTAFTVTFSPGAAGARTAGLHIASNDSDESPFDITLTGMGLMNSAPEIAAEQPSGTDLTDGSAIADFGSGVVGGSSQRTFTIRNRGNADLTGLGITITGPNSNDFTVTANLTVPLAPCAITTFTVTFSPGIAGARTADVHITSNDSDESPFDITLTGTGVAAAPGDLDPLDANPGNGGIVQATAVQPDGKTIIAGNFTSVLGVARSNIARLNADGTLDMGFNPKADSSVVSVAVQADGKVLLGGGFSTLQPNGAGAATARSCIARVNADGTLDTGFDPNPDNGNPGNFVNSVTVQADGKVLLGGHFTTLQPNGAGVATERNGIARVNADGMLDTGFDPGAGDWTSDWVSSVAVQADGKVLIGGAYGRFSFGPHHIARVNADGTPDTGFNPTAGDWVFSVAVQADGKVLFGGAFTAVNGVPRNYIARLNANGTLDTGFNPRPSGRVFSMAVQADGKVLLAGAFTTLQPNGAASPIARQHIARLNADGTLDMGFDPRADDTVTGVAVQADGKVLLGGSFTTLQPNGAATATVRKGFARLLNDPATQTLTVPDATQALWQRGGAAPELSRVTFELSTDDGASWTPLGAGTRIGTTANWRLTSLLSGSGSLRARGVATGGYQNGSSGLTEQVTTFSGFPISSNANLSALTTSAGALTPAFATAATAYTASVLYGTSSITVTPTAAQGNAAIQVRANGGTFAGVTSGGTSAALALNVGANPLDVLVTAHDGSTTKTYTLTVTRAAPVLGNLDPLDVNLVNGDAVYATAVQPDGKTIIAGHFASVLGVPRSNIARLNADGTLDTGFDPKPDGTVDCVAVQVDGKVLLGGSFFTLQPNGAGAATARRSIARVNADGTLDTGFDPRADSAVGSVAVQADGKVLLGGYFTTLQPNGAGATTPRQHIARVNADGTLDTGFDPKPDGTVNSVAVQADGKVLLGGWFTTLQPNGAGAATPRRSIARVNADGTLDTGFDPRAGGEDSGVDIVAVQADGKVLLGGYFTTLQPNGAAAATARNKIARVNADGTLDTGFNPKANFSVSSVALQADGKVLLGGEFTTLQPNGAAAATARRKCARVNADGTLDMGFDPRADSEVTSVGLQTDGKVLLGGWFNTLQPNGASTATVRIGFARLLNDPATQTLSVPDAGQALWQRGGAAPELSRVTFELSTDGGANWTPLGAGTRIGTTANWQRTGLSLPASGQLRARGVTTGGYGNGSSGLIEQVAAFPFSADADDDGLLDSWELTWWPVTAGHSPHDDDDRDGLDNLLELAFGLNPTLPDTGGLPVFTNEGGFLTVTINKQPGVVYEAQSASIPLQDSFSAANTTVLINNATTLKVRDNFPISTGPRRFLRVKVTAAP